MNIVVAGAGAVGLTLAALLTNRGHAVSVLARDRHVARLRRHGIELRGSLGEVHAKPAFAAVHPYELPAGHYDVVLVTVKSFDTAALIASCRPLIGPDTVVVSVQNGMGNLDTLEEQLGLNQPLFGCVALFGCEIGGPGLVRIASQTCEAKLGPYGEAGEAKSDVAARLAADLTAAGMRTTLSENIQVDIWGKFIMNTMTNALAAIEEKTLSELFTNERTLLTMDALLEEIFAVSDSLRIELPWKNPEDFLGFYRKNILPRFGSHRPSMAQDLASGRRTEINALNGHLVRLAGRQHSEAPVNAYLTKIVQKRERQFQFPSPILAVKRETMRGVAVHGA